MKDTAGMQVITGTVFLYTIARIYSLFWFLFLFYFREEAWLSINSPYLQNNFCILIKWWISVSTWTKIFTLRYYCSIWSNIHYSHQYHKDPIPFQRDLIATSCSCLPHLQIILMRLFPWEMSYLFHFCHLGSIKRF